MKMISVEGARQAFHEQPTIPIDHPNGLELDLTDLPALDAAQRIIEHVDRRSSA